MTDQEAVEVLTSCAGGSNRLARIIGMSPEHVSRLRAGRYPVPEWMHALAEAMNALPRKDWPARWTETP